MSPAKDARGDVVRRAVELLRAGAGVELYGLPGSGRSETLRAAIEQVCASPSDALIVRGRSALHDRPFAALALSGVDVPPTQPHAALFAELVNRLAERVVNLSAVAIDDVDDLDDASVAVLSEAMAEHQIPVLLSRRPQLLPRHSGPWGDLIRLSLPDLDLEALHSTVTQLLPGTVDAAGMARMAGASGRLPGLLRTMIIAGRSEGTIVFRHPSWVVDGDLWTPGVGAVLDRLVSELNAETLDALEAIAGAEGGVPHQDAAVPAALHRLRRAGLLGPPEGTGPGRVFPPLLAEHLRRRDGHASRTEESAHRPFDTLTHMHERWATDLSQRRAEWLASPTATTAGPLLVALHQLSVDPVIVLDVLSRTDSDTGSEEDRAGLALGFALYEALGQDDLDNSARVLAEATTRLPRFDGLFRAIAAHIRYLIDAIPSESILEIAGDPEIEVRTGAQTSVYAETLIAQGRIDDARPFLDHPGDSGWFSTGLDLCRGLAILLDGDPLEAARFSADRLVQAQAAMDGPTIESMAYLRTLSLFFAGRTAELQEHLADVLTLAHVPLLQRHLRQGTLTLAAVDALARGRTGLSISLLTQSAVLGTHDGPLPGMVPSLMDPFAAAVNTPEDPGFASEMWQRVLDRLDRGYVVHAVSAAVWVAEHWPGPSELTARLGDIAAKSQSRVVRALGKYLMALCVSDGVALESAARALSAVGLDGYGQRADIEAARSYWRLGDASMGAGIATREWDSMMSTGAGLREAFGVLIDEVDLTTREREIAEAMSAGLGNAELAARLNLSVRTVESHVSNVLRKTGVDGREGLRTALATWLKE